MSIKSTTLYFTQGSSDKQYMVQIDETEDHVGFIVSFAFGRRGQAMQHRVKTEQPVPMAEAEEIMEKMLHAKKLKGYVESEDGIAYSATPDKEVTGWLPQLLNIATEEELLEAFRTWESMYIQTKHDGCRRGVFVTDGVAVGANRRGLRVALAQVVQDSVESFAAQLGARRFDIDTEDMGEFLKIFNVIAIEETDYNLLPFAMRAQMLQALEADIQKAGLDMTLQVDVPTLVTSEEMLLEFIARARANNEEGIVVQQGEAICTIGRPNSGGPALKHKFVESATVLCDGQNGDTRSVGMLVRSENGSAYEHMGNCTIGGKLPIPKKGQFIEVEYLYAYPDGGNIYQPAYKGVREDKILADTYESLKFKRIT